MNLTRKLTTKDIRKKEYRYQKYYKATIKLFRKFTENDEKTIKWNLCYHTHLYTPEFADRFLKENPDVLI